MNSYQDALVSVIMPVYNGERHLGKALQSILDQTHPCREIVVVDDCSTDKSEEILKAYSKRGCRLVCHRLERNSGAAVARNHALKLAQGRYVAFLDSDDCWHPAKTEKQLACLNGQKAAICYTAVEIIGDDDSQLKPKRKIPPKIDYGVLLRNTAIATSSVLIDRQRTGQFEMPLLRNGQDYATWLQLLRGGAVAYGIDEVLVKYRKGANSLSARKWDSIRQVYGIQTKLEGIPKLSASLNVMYFAWNAFRKYYL